MHILALLRAYKTKSMYLDRYHPMPGGIFVNADLGSCTAPDIWKHTVLWADTSDCGRFRKKYTNFYKTIGHLFS